MTFIDLVPKRTYFIPTHMAVTIEGIVKLFLYNIWKLYSLLAHIILDRRLQFIVYFIKELYCMLDIKIASFMIWHL